MAWSRRVTALLGIVGVLGTSLAFATSAHSFDLGFVDIDLGDRTSVDVGEQFTIDAGWGDPVLPDGLQVQIEFRAPAQTTILSARALGDDGSCSVVEQNVVCTIFSRSGAASLSVELEASEPANDVSFVVSGGVSGIGGASGSVSVDIIDPSITADLSPTVELPGIAGLGTTIDGSIVLVNHGPTSMVGSEVMLTTDPALDLVAAELGGTPCLVVDGAAVCAAGTVDGHSDVAGTLSLVANSATPNGTLTASVSSSTPQDDPETHPDVVIATIVIPDEPAADIGIEIRPRGGTPVVGLQQFMDVEVTNNGPEASTVAMTGSLTGTYDSTYLLTNRISPVVRCTIADLGDIECGSVEMRAGQSVIWTFGYVPSDTSGGALTLAVSGDIPDPTPDPSPNHAMEPVPSADPPSADLDVAIIGPDDPFALTDYTHFVVVQNDGPWAASDVLIEIQLPETYEIGFLGTGSLSCDARPGVLSCEPSGDLRAGRQLRVTMELAATEIGPNPPIVATAVAGLPDPDGARAEFARSYRAPTADVQWETDAPFTELRTGVATDFALTYRNLGPAAANNTQVDLDVPDGVAVTLRGFSVDECAVDERGDLSCDTGRTPAGNSGSVLLTITDPVARTDAQFVATVATPTPLPAGAADSYPRVFRWESDTLAAVPSDVSGLAVTDGPPIAGTRVFAYRVGSGSFVPDLVSTVADDGTYEFDRVDAGFYRFMFIPPDGSTLAPTRYRSSGARPEGRVVRIPGDGSDVILLTDTVDTEVTISGTLVDDGGAPVAGAIVQVFHRYVPWLRYGRTTTAADGTYSVNGMQGGSYTVWFGIDGRHTWWEDSTWNDATAIRLSSGESRTGADAVVP